MILKIFSVVFKVSNDVFMDIVRILLLRT